MTDDFDLLALRMRLIAAEARIKDADSLMEAGIGARHRCIFCGRFPPIHWEGCEYAAYLTKWTDDIVRTDVKNGKVHND